jgi:hypothetical protein
MGETDITFRRLLRGIPRPILRLAFPRRQLEPLGPIDPSVDRVRQRTADNLFRVRDGRTQAAIHVEVEREWRAAIPPRLFEYASVAAAAIRLPLSSVVVLLRPGGRPPPSIGVYRVPGIGGDAFVFRYHVVPLWRLDARRMRAELGLQGAPFCVAMRGSNESFVQELAADVVADRNLSSRDRSSTLQLLYIVSAAILGSDTARRIFHMESIIQDPNVQELIREWEDKGRAEGRAEGRALEARLLLHRVLAARSFRVTPDIRKRIDGESDVARLESWLEAAVTADTLGDVFRDG